MQLIAYIVDIYNGKVASEKNFFKFLLFVSFFPQVIQGPIPRYSQLSPQLTEGNRFDENGFVKGFMLIIWGFFLKLCIADKAAVIVNTVFDNSNRYVGWYVFIAGVLYSIQLYTDFLSCTTLAQGVAALFGIQIVDNFMHPYFATSIKDFWRRWHMSLSSWLRDYVYIPLGGNRKGVARKYINIMITFAVSGIWHGAGLKYLFWGLLHGLYQVIGDLTNPTRIKASKVLKIDKNSKEYQFLSQLITFFLVMIAWIIFRADSLRVGLRMIKSMVTDWNPWILTDNSLFALGLSWKEVAVLILSLMILITVSIMQERDIIIRDCIIKRPIVTRWIVYICAIIFITVFGTYGYGFDAQSFIYGGF
jgi:D-alanyl-lipoteichoic acid acyltransferase DltB (MBOAT superfamily)